MLFRIQPSGRLRTTNLIDFGYRFGSDVKTESTFIATAADRSIVLNGVPADAEYSIKVMAYRDVDNDIEPSGLILSGSAIAPSSPYIPETQVAFAGDIQGTINGASASAIALSSFNFDKRNDRNGNLIAAPVIANDQTAIDHTLNADGSANISFEWTWNGVNADIDGWTVYVRSSSLPMAYTLGASPAEEQTYNIPADRRAIILSGIPAIHYYSFFVQAYRVVDPDIDPSGMIKSDVVYSTASGEFPYQPTQNIAFAGDISGTVNGTDVAVLVGNASSGATAFNETAKYRVAGAPTNNPTPTSISITANSNGTRNVRLDWAAYTQGTRQADMLLVFWTKTTNAPTVNDSAVSVNVNTTGASYYVFEGVSPSETMSFGIAAARRTEEGVVLGTIVSPSASPKWRGIATASPDYKGLLDGTDAATVVSNSLDPAKVINEATTQIDPGKITIQGATTLSNWITPNTTTIDGGKITTNSITADSIAANSINAKHLVLGDTSNIFRNPDFANNNRDAWTVSNLEPVVTVASIGGANAPAFQYASSLKGSTSSRTTVGIQAMPVTPGDQYYMETWVRATSDYVGTFQHYFRHYSVSNASGSPSGQIFASLGTAWTKITSTITVPEGAAWIDVGLRTQGASSDGVGAVYFTGCRLRRKNEGSLIVDGGISATKLEIGTLSQNLVWNPNPDVNEIGTDGWYIYRGSGSFTTATTTVPGMGSRRFNFSAPSSGAVACRPFPVTPGETYTIKFRGGLAASSAATNSKYIRMSWVANLPTNGQISYVDGTEVSLNNESIAWSSVVADESYTWTAPQTAKFATLAIYLWNGATSSLMLDNFDIRAGTNSAVIIGPGQIHASSITANSITADNIAANAINASHIAAGAISASRMSISDMTNFFLDAGFADASYWVLNSGSYDTTTTAALTALRANKAFKSVATGATATPDSNIQPVSNLTVEGGKTYRVRYMWYGTAGLNAAIFATVDWYDVSGSLIASNIVYGFPDYRVTPLGAATGAEFSSQIAAPANAVSCRPRIAVRWATGASVGTAFIATPMFQRAMSGELVVDGSITASKLILSANTNENKLPTGFLLGDTNKTLGDVQTDATTALTGTTNYRTTGAPTNAPSPTGITITQNSNGTCNIRLSWAAYTQGVRQADWLVLFWRKDNAAPTINDSATQFTVNTSAASYYVFEGVNPADTYSFGIAAARRTETGVEITAIQAPVTSPVWRNVGQTNPVFSATIGGSAMIGDTGVTAGTLPYQQTSAQGSQSLFFNQKFELVAQGTSPARPQGVKSAQSTTALTGDTMLAYVTAGDYSSGLSIGQGLNATIRVFFPMWRVNPTATYRVRGRAKVSAVGTSGFYARFVEFDGTPATNITHLGGTAGVTYDDPTILAPTRERTGGTTALNGVSIENSGLLTTSYQDFTVTVTPTATAKYMGFEILRWSGISPANLHIESILIEEVAPVSLFELDPAKNELLTTLDTNFNTRNDRDGSEIISPYLNPNTAIKNVINTDGSANISLEWAWDGAEEDIDGFTVVIHQGDQNSGRSPSGAVARNMFF